MKSTCLPILSIGSEDVEQINKANAWMLPKGTVILVRSDYKHEKYKDHFALLVGGIIQKERGIRPNVLTLPTAQVYNYLFGKYTQTDGAIILQLKPAMADQVMEAYGIHLSEGKLISI